MGDRHLCPSSNNIRILLPNPNIGLQLKHPRLPLHKQPCRQRDPDFQAPTPFTRFGPELVSLITRAPCLRVCTDPVQFGVDSILVRDLCWDAVLHLCFCADEFDHKRLREGARVARVGGLGGAPDIEEVDVGHGQRRVLPEMGVLDGQAELGGPGDVNTKWIVC